MKYLAVILLLTTFTSCSGNSGSALFAQNENRIELDEAVLKYVRYNHKILTLTNATVIDGKGIPTKEKQTLIIVNGYFQTIGREVDIPKNAIVINVEGKTIIPGIVGIHNHLHIPQFPFIGEVASKLYLASGVTTIQTCGSAGPEQEIELAKKILKGKIIGPDIITSGPYFTGNGGNPNMIIPRSEQHIRDTMKHWTNKGVRWFKVYRHIQLNDLKTIIREAHKQGAKVTGHLCSITFEQAANTGIDGIEHGLNSASDFRKNKDFGACNGSREYMDSLDITSENVNALQQLMIKKNVFLTSTLAIYESSIPQRAFADKRTLDAMSPYLLTQYQERRKQYDSLDVNDSVRENRLKRIMEFEYQFFKMGGVLAAGVDAGRHVLPGFGDQRNFELLIEAGFTTEEAVQIMTSNGAKVLSNSKIGSIEVGKRADFLIIDGDLKENPANIKKVEIVFKEGYGYDAKAILKDIKGKVGLQ